MIIPLGWINVRVVRARSCKRGYTDRFALPHRIHLAQFVTNPRPRGKRDRRENDISRKIRAVIIDDSLGAHSALLIQRTDSQNVRATRATTWTFAIGERQVLGAKGINESTESTFARSVFLSNGVFRMQITRANETSSGICRVQIQIYRYKYIEGGVRVCFCVKLYELRTSSLSTRRQRAILLGKVYTVAV